MDVKYRAEIDGLRAIAVVAVILFHAGIPAIGGGFVGVDIFFVISGYLITSIIIADKEANRFSIARFYERRARRILPALFLVLLACLIPAWLWLPPRDMISFCKSLFTLSLFSSNFLFWSEAGYFDISAELKPLLHTWSLAVEEQFYLFFPMLIALVWPFGRRWVVAVVVVLGFASYGAAHIGVVYYPNGAFFLLPTRGWELLLGAAVALYHSVSPVRLPDNFWKRALYDVASVAGLALITYSVYSFSKQTPFPSVYTLAPTLGTCILLLFCVRGTLVSSLLSLRLLVGLGLISYSAYLWHYPIFAFARHISVSAPGQWAFSLLSLVTFGLAYLSWRFVERPFRDPHRVSRIGILVFSIGGIFGLGSFGSHGVVSNGFDAWRVNAEQRAVLGRIRRNPLSPKCLYEERDSRPKTPCVHNDGVPSWAILGDSHASELAMMLGLTLKERGEALKQFSSKGKPWFNHLCKGAETCRTWTEHAIDQIVDDPNIRNIVVIYRINLHLFGEHVPTYPHLPNSVSTESRAAIWNNYVEVLNRLNSSGKRVILVLQPPEVRKSLPNLVFQSRLSPSNIAGVSREWWALRSAYVTKRLKDIPQSVRVVDPTDIFCDEINCTAVRDGVSWYFDEDHLSLEGASKIVPRLLEEGKSAGSPNSTLNRPKKDS